VLSGIPSSSAVTSNVTVSVTDDASHTGTATLSLAINSGASTFTISGQITSSGAALSGVTVTLGTGQTTTTNTSGNYSFTGLANGTYSVTPSRSGYTFNPASQNVTISNGNQTTVNFTGSLSTATARAVSINFVGDGPSLAAGESAGVVAKTNWNNAIQNTGSSLPLMDETGASNGATVSWNSDNTWSVPISGTTGNVHMIQGYLDTGAGNPTTVNVSGLPASSTGYDVYVYTDGDNAGTAKTATYSISGAGITTTNISATDAANANFNGTFTAGANYVKFNAVQATAFTITATPVSTTGGGLRAPVNGIQVVPH
jgi:hypothetical protein